MKEIERISPSDWERMLTRVFQSISANPKCAPILADIGQVHFQLLIKDRPEFSYWEEYLGDRVIPHLGLASTSTVQAATTFSVLLGTLLRRISVMEAAADEAYELTGDTAALMRCANILPHVMITFSKVFAEEFPTSKEPHHE